MCEINLFVLNLGYCRVKWTSGIRKFKQHCPVISIPIHLNSLHQQNIAGLSLKRFFQASGRSEGAKEFLRSKK
jgi:hypothetical protein